MATRPPATSAPPLDADLPALAEARKAMRAAAEKIDGQRDRSVEAAARVGDAVAGLRHRLDAAGPRLESRLADLSAARASLDDVRQRLAQKRQAEGETDTGKRRRVWLRVLLAALALAVAAGLAVVALDSGLMG